MTPLAIPFPDIGPNLIEIGPIAIRWYALAYIFGLIFAWKWVERMIRRPALWPGDRAPMQPGQPEELLTWMAVGVILGGRLGYVIFYKPGYYLQNPAEILMIWEGGMAFHGGFLGVILGVILWCRAKKLPLLSVGDAVACATPMGLLFGRLPTRRRAVFRAIPASFTRRRWRARCCSLRCGGCRTGAAG